MMGRFCFLLLQPTHQLSSGVILYTVCVVLRETVTAKSHCHFKKINDLLQAHIKTEEVSITGSVWYWFVYYVVMKKYVEHA